MVRTRTAIERERLADKNVLMSRSTKEREFSDLHKAVALARRGHLDWAGHAQGPQGIDPSSVISLQRLVGNAAVSSILASSGSARSDHDPEALDQIPDPVKGQALPRRQSELSTSASVAGKQRISLQRTLATKPGDLDKLVSGVDAIKGKLGKGGKGKETFAAVRSALSDYKTGLSADQSTISKTFGLMAFMEWQLDHLALIDVLCTRFLNENQQDDKRRPIIERLHEEVTSERLAITKKGSHEIYQNDIAASAKDSGGFEALSEYSKLYGTKERSDKKESRAEMNDKYGLTDAEFSAILVYSAQDFQYINPSTANSASWLEKQKKDNKDENFAKVDDKTVKEEGSLHTALAMQGMAKLPRYVGEAYRGARQSPEDFAKEFAVGKEVRFTNLKSTSVDKSVAVDFIFGLGTGTPPRAEQSVASLVIYDDPGGVDIGKIAIQQKEKEVLVAPGTTFQVTSIQKMDPKVDFGTEMYEAAAQKYPPERLPAESYIIRLTRIEAPKVH